MAPVTTCESCGTTRNETVAAHLEAHHLDEFFRIDFDPETEIGVIGERTIGVQISGDEPDVLGFVCDCGVNVTVPTTVVDAHSAFAKAPWQVVCPVCGDVLWHNGTSTLHIALEPPVGEAAAEEVDEIHRIDIEEFRSAGYLQEVNRTFLHPLGLALEVRTDGDGRAVALGGVWDYREDPEGMRYAEDVIDLAKVDRVAAEWDEKAGTRAKSLGYVVQPPPAALR